MALDGFIVTDAGAQLLMEAALGSELVFTRAAIGSGALSAESDIAACTALVQHVADMALSAPVVNGDSVTLRAQFISEDGAGGYLPAFRWNEAGLFARVGTGGEVLLAYANTRDAQAGDYIPQAQVEFELAFTLGISGADMMHMSSEGMIYATKPEIDAANARIDGLEAALEAQTHPAGEVTAGTLGGKVQANATAAATLNAAQLRNIIIATSAPASGIANGDIWLMYS